MFDQRGELPLLPFGNPIGFVLASRGGAYIILMSAGKAIIDPGKEGTADGPIKDGIQSTHNNTAGSSASLVARIERAHDLKKGCTIGRPEKIGPGDHQKAAAPQDSGGDC